jgi:hypothetical protein
VVLVVLAVPMVLALLMMLAMLPVMFAVLLVVLAVLLVVLTVLGRPTLVVLAVLAVFHVTTMTTKALAVLAVFALSRVTAVATKTFVVLAIPALSVLTMFTMLGDTVLGRAVVGFLTGGSRGRPRSILGESLSERTIRVPLLGEGPFHTRSQVRRLEAGEGTTGIEVFYISSLDVLPNIAILDFSSDNISQFRR